jgi:hypothetical protein
VAVERAGERQRGRGVTQTAFIALFASVVCGGSRSESASKPRPRAPRCGSICVNLEMRGGRNVEKPDRRITLQYTVAIDVQHFTRKAGTGLDS